MKTICYATHNANKIEEMQRWLADYAVRVVGPDTFNVPLIVEETADSPCGNALLKARVGFAQTHMACIGQDSAFQFLDLDPQDPDQPGLYARRTDGVHEMSEDEMLTHYQRLAHRHGGRLMAAYLDGWAVVDETGQEAVFQLTDPKLIRAGGFWLCESAHPVRHPGWPLDSLSLDPETGLYFTEERPDERQSSSTRSQARKEGLRQTVEFLARSLKLQRKKAV